MKTRVATICGGRSGEHEVSLQSARSKYDLAQGLLTSYRDPAGQETTFRWDALQHLVGIVKPGDSAQFPRLAFEYL